MNKVYPNSMALQVKESPKGEASLSKVAIEEEEFNKVGPKVTYRSVLLALLSERVGLGSSMNAAASSCQELEIG